MEQHRRCYKLIVLVSPVVRLSINNQVELNQMSIYDSLPSSQKWLEKTKLHNNKECGVASTCPVIFGSSLLRRFMSLPKAATATGEMHCILLCYMHFVNFFRHSRTTARQQKRTKLLCSLHFGSRSARFGPKSTETLALKYFSNCNFS